MIKNEIALRCAALPALQEGVGAALFADGGVGSVAGEDAGFAGQGEEACGDGFDNLGIVAAGQVSASDAAGKKGVASHEKIERGEMKADGALRVAWGVQNHGGKAAETDNEAVGEQLVRGRSFRSGHAEPGSLGMQRLE